LTGRLRVAPGPGESADLDGAAEAGRVLGRTGITF